MNKLIVLKHFSIPLLLSEFLRGLTFHKFKIIFICDQNAMNAPNRETMVVNMTEPIRHDEKSISTYGRPNSALK